jgi:predicted RNA methylase
VAYDKHLDEVEKSFAKLGLQALELGLDRAPPMRILDLGTGPGCFARICQELGHDCIGLEMPRPEFEALSYWVGAKIVWDKMLPMIELSDFGHRFDLVTAFHIQFNTSKGRGAKRLYNLYE